MKPKIKQSFNNRIGAWVKYQKQPDGKIKILNVKEKNPTVKFKGVRTK